MTGFVSTHPALVLTAHGSADPRAAAVTHAIAGRIRRLRPELDVRAAFLEHSTPHLPDVLRQVEAPVVTPFVAPAPEAPSATISPIFAALGIGALVLVVGSAILYWKYSRDKRMTRSLVSDKRDRLFTEIAALDDQHAAGELDDETWSAERLALMNNLRTVMAELERLDGGRRGAGNRG